jgi:hypothetical protein
LDGKEPFVFHIPQDGLEHLSIDNRHGGMRQGSLKLHNSTAVSIDLPKIREHLLQQDATPKWSDRPFRYRAPSGLQHRPIDQLIRPVTGNADHTCDTLPSTTSASDTLQKTTQARWWRKTHDEIDVADVDADFECHRGYADGMSV